MFITSVKKCDFMGFSEGKIGPGQALFSKMAGDLFFKNDILENNRSFCDHTIICDWEKNDSKKSEDLARKVVGIANSYLDKRGKSNRKLSQVAI